MEFVIHNPLDMHIHFRDGEMKDVVAPLTSLAFSGALIMPNLVPPIKTIEELTLYKQRIETVTSGDNFTPYMTVFFHEGLTREILLQLKGFVTTIKLYPAGITTNSE